MISIRAVLKGTCGRFLPVCALLMEVGVVPLVASGVDISPWAPLRALVYSLSAAAGYGAVLVSLRRRLSADAPVAGGPSITAGVLGPLVIMLSLLGPPRGTVLTHAVLPAAGGAMLALAMFFAWLAKPPEVPMVQSDTHDEHFALSEGQFDARDQRREPEAVERRPDDIARLWVQPNIA